MQMNQERFEKQREFILEIDKEKEIYRQTHLTNHGRREGDAEHAWHMAIMAYLLREYSNSEVDIAHVMMMCLIHDIVEIDAGDTYAYDEEGLKALAARINAFAVSEDLPAHGECVLSRFVKDPYDKATLREQEKEAGLR